MKKIRIWILGILLLIIIALLVGTYSPTASNTDQDTISQRIVKIGLLLRPGEEYAECNQELVKIYQEEIDKFNIDHQIMHAELLTGDWKSGEDSVENLYNKGASSVVGPACPVAEGEAIDVRRGLGYNSIYETYTDEEWVEINMVTPIINEEDGGLVEERFDEDQIGSEPCDTISCPASRTYDHVIPYADGYIGFVFEGQGTLLDVSLRYITQDYQRYRRNVPYESGIVLVYGKNVKDESDTSHMYLYLPDFSTGIHDGKQIMTFDCSNTDTYVGEFNNLSRCSRLAMSYVFDLIRGYGQLGGTEYTYPSNEIVLQKVIEFKKAIDEGDISLVEYS